MNTNSFLTSKQMKPTQLLPAVSSVESQLGSGNGKEAAAAATTTTSSSNHNNVYNNYFVENQNNVYGVPSQQHYRSHSKDINNTVYNNIVSNGMHTNVKPASNINDDDASSSSTSTSATTLTTTTNTKMPLDAYSNKNFAVENNDNKLYNLSNFPNQIISYHPQYTTYPNIQTGYQHLQANNNIANSLITTNSINYNNYNNYSNFGDHFNVIYEDDLVENFKQPSFSELLDLISNSVLNENSKLGDLSKLLSEEMEKLEQRKHKIAVVIGFQSNWSSRF
ncbi:hypothetical protein HELRODRAFT_161384 [Helobdella robusta]|uniref:Uncharacterized protein n=1 Tax=Helobdella robusta TaxID=6412 RepID=T1ERF2_HELRO|nr:hypothetical protein HELRODRAFT_161384 [Helobdella robusta]ESO02147.1 hypothetical protein HELRODRAFT_161384 [Helobdella robusta]